MNIMELIRKEVQAQIALLAVPQEGIVTSINPDGMSVKVDLNSIGAESGWLRMISPVAGVNAAVGMRMPKEGDEVLCIFTDFDHDSGYVIGACSNDVETPANGKDTSDPSIHPDCMVVAQWENGGRIIVDSSRDPSHPVITITNNQKDLIKIEDGAIQVFVDNGKLVQVGDTGAKFLAYADQTDARLDKLESYMGSHQHGNGNFGAPTTQPILPLPFIAGGSPPGGTVTTKKIKGT